MDMVTNYHAVNSVHEGEQFHASVLYLLKLVGVSLLLGNFLSVTESER